MNILTIVTADVDQGRGQDLIAAYQSLLAGGLPDGLLETRLLGDGQGHWPSTRCGGTAPRSMPCGLHRNRLPLRRCSDASRASRP